MELGAHWTNIYEVWYYSIFRISDGKFQVALRSDKNDGTSADDPRTFRTASRWILQMQIFQTKVADKLKTHVLFSITIFTRIVRLRNKVENRYSQTGYKSQYKRAHALYMLDNKGYRHILRICNVYFSSTTTVITRTRLDIRFIRPLPLLLNLVVRKVTTGR